MKRRAAMIIGAVALCSAVLGGGGTAAVGLATAASARAGTSDGQWGQAEPLPGLAALGGGGTIGSTVSCGSAGNCSVGGQYAGGSLAFVANEVDGTWGSAEEVPGLAALDSDITYSGIESVSCVSAGNCSAVGYYTGAGIGYEPFVVSEVGGTWGSAKDMPASADLNAGGFFVPYLVSCASAGNCSAGGDYVDSSGTQQAFVANQANGTWGNAEEVPGIAGLNVGRAPTYRGQASVSSVSCASAGDCSAVGYYIDSIGAGQAFVVSQVHGSWRQAEEMPGAAALSGRAGTAIASVSCASAGDCSGGGNYAFGADHRQALVISQVNGSWGSPEEVPGSAALNVGGSAGIDSVSCASPGDCSAGGQYTDGSGNEQVFVVSEVNGVWGKAQEVPGSAALDAGGWAHIESVSCASAGNCSAAGVYEQKGSTAQQVFVVSEVDGVWGSAEEVPGTGAVNTGGNFEEISVSCALPGNCTAAGKYGQPFVVSEVTPGSAASATAITSTTSHPVVGQPVTVKVAVSATPVGSGTPTGAVTVIAGAQSCRARLSDRGGESTGSCTIRENAAGRYPITASYPGTSVFGASTSPRGGLDVAKARSRTALHLSVPTVAYGHERALKLSVHVTPEFSGAPAGTATITTGTKTLCRVTVTARSGGWGSCRLASNRRLGRGKHLLTARYHGSSGFFASASRRVTLHVT